jgi:hypothetical protein
MALREFEDDRGRRWTVSEISTGRSSPYLNDRVQRPLLQFDCAADPGPSRYAMLDRKLGESLATVSVENLMVLLGRSKVH